MVSSSAHLRCADARNVASVLIVRAPTGSSVPYPHRFRDGATKRVRNDRSRYSAFRSIPT